jgi:hypothetical protein
VLSLDAPTVALLWQWELARAGSAVLAAPEAIVLGASVWLAYVADRWIEGWRLNPARIRTARHSFYLRWRWPVAGIWLAVLAWDMDEAWSGLSRGEWVGGWLLLAAVAVYLFSHQLVHRHHPWRLPKEACVALLMAGGVALFTAGSPVALLTTLSVPLAIFALLCFTNCALISAWEESVDRSHGQTSLALQFKAGAALGHWLPWIVAALAALAWALGGAAQRPAEACALSSALLLAGVDRAEPRMGMRLARVLSDAVLMTPLAHGLAVWSAATLGNTTMA